MLLARLESFIDDTICTFAYNHNLVLGCPNNHGHSLPITVEFENVKQFVPEFFVGYVVVYYNVVVVVAVFKSKAKMSHTVN